MTIALTIPDPASIDAPDFRLIHRRYNRTTDLMTMADGGYDPMGHIQTGRPHAYYLYQAAAAALEQHHHQQQQQQQQQQLQRDQQPQQQQLQEQTSGDPAVPVRSRPPSDDGHENNNNLPAAANNNLFRSEQKKHKRKRLSAVLDKLHNGTGTVVNHNNNNVGEAQGFQVKCMDSRSSAEDSTEDTFPYAASPRISVSPLRLSEGDENNPHQGRTSNSRASQHTPAHDQQLPSPSQVPRQAKLESQQQSPVAPLQPAQIKQEDQQYLYKQLQYFNPLALFNYLPEPTKLLYEEFARQRSHSDSDLRLPQLARQNPPKKKRAGQSGKASQRPPTASSRSSNASSAGSGSHDPQDQPLDLSMKTLLFDPYNLPVTTVIKEEPQLTYSPPPDASSGRLVGPAKLILKREDLSDLRRSPYEQLNGHGPGGFNLNVSPVVEEMPPGSDVAYMCPVCGQLFSLQDRLAKHMASRHKSRTGATDITKSYMCEVCQRSFARSDMLTRHMRLHTGVKPYSCKVCGQIFSRSDHLSTHQRTHTGEKPYKCPQCPYAACRRDMITRHMRTHTRYESQRGSGGGSSGGSISPSMDQKPIMLPLVELGGGRTIMKEASFGGVGAGFVLEAKTES
ncbi:zinc finger protein 263-like [Anopheles nili]|uniref:zinc finger protein 263-like n=1 Tax=Anopheles nili TaxID=185578 RepID=UPI00237AB8F8|nr:zinc finger protein 263-like [Anopheles nili]